MRGGGPAAAADHVDAVRGDEGLEGLGHGGGFERVDGLAVHVEGQARVGDDRDGLGGALGEDGDGPAHVLGAGGAVETDHVDGQGLEDGDRRRDVGAEQHAPAGVEGDLDLKRNALARLLEVALDARDRSLHLQDVLGGFDQEHVAATLDQGLGLLLEDGRQLLEGDVAEGRIVAAGQHAGGADGACDEAGMLGGAVAVRHPARQLRGRVVLLVGAIAEAVLLELGPVAAEGIGLEHVAADRHEAVVDRLDHLGLHEHQVLVATFGRH
ncbi:hypothetical protein D3C86_1481320 [compost metagenome]